MNTAQLECFISLAGTLNYMKTAEQLGLTQPAVTKQIQSLEAELGCKLFHRTTRSVTLTKIGAAFLADATTMIDTFYHSMERLSGFQEQERHALRIGYMDPHAIQLISRILTPLLSAQSNVIPEFHQDQTDANLSRLVNHQLDLIIGMKDARFKDPDIAFTMLHEEYFVCAMHKDHPLAVKFKQHRQKSVSTSDLWEQRQIISIPPYLLGNFFSRGRHIVPVNDDLDNAICSNANETYGLLLAGFGYAYLPEHQIMKHPDIVTFAWKESPHAPFGVYSKVAVLKDRSSSEFLFLQNAKEIYRV
ncbi:MAG: LysR family transcriptional regulator [Lachnospiraceae bacterium]|nr:LysR family transcriptional regulator [Lachnospiraceae bacterium]